MEGKAQHPMQRDAACPEQQTSRPYNSSYFLPESVSGKVVLFLIDTGCTTNTLAKHVFDRLPEVARRQIQLYADTHGTVADSSVLVFLGLVELACQVWNVATVEIFIFSHCKENAILGMPFLVRQNCAMKVDRTITLLPVMVRG